MDIKIIGTPFKDLAKELTNFPVEFEKIDDVIEDIGKQGVEQAKENAPPDKKLQDSLGYDVQLTKDDIGINFGNNDRTVDILRYHEEPFKSTKLVSSPTSEGGVGNKFFSRVIDYWSDNWATRIGEALFTRR